MSNESTIEQIPSPDGMPIIGNMLTVDSERPLQGLMEITRKIGPIFQLDMMGTPIVIASGVDLVTELCDEERFDKAVRGSLRRVRAIGGDGLFTGDTSEPNWSKAHNILLPTFSRQAMNNYMPMMLDVASQLVTKWERLNADDDINVVHDMTALALDTIGICGFDYRFNSFYRQDYHPFINALTRTLETCMLQRGLPFESVTLKGRLDQMKEDVSFMNKLVDDIIRKRRKGGTSERGGEGHNDLLNYMLAGVDKVTGESLSDENIRYQINTFLIAGHETTSGLLSFVLYFLLNNPKVLEKAYREVDEVLGRDVSVEPTIKKINQLGYIQQILFESLRLWPTAPALGLNPYQDEVIGGKYELKKRTFVTVLTLMLHRDKSVWGESPDVFNPDHFHKDAIAGRPINAYKPFGNGQRACIGRQFAIQEATLVIAMILQRFELIDHQNYELKIRESMSIKPDGFRMKVRMRPQVLRSKLIPGGMTSEETRLDSLAEVAQLPGHGTPALILYGSNLGGTEEFARSLARSADLNGFETKLATLDEYAGKLPRDGVVLLASSSYNGTPPDNAEKFVSWLKTARTDEAEGVNYAIFGCGNSDWAATFQSIPKAIDDGLQRMGAKRIGALGAGDARDDIDDQFQNWVDELWPQVAEELKLDVDLLQTQSSAPLYEVDVLSQQLPDNFAQETGARPAVVLMNSELQNRSEEHASKRSTRHIEFSLPDGMTYRPGDHLSVVPKNSNELVARVLDRFAIEKNALIQISTNSTEHSQLPIDVPVNVSQILSDYVELQSVATRKNVEMLTRHTQCPKSLPSINNLFRDDYHKEVLWKRRSILDILEMYPACELPLGVFLEMSPSMTPRYYSISSSPAVERGQCSITVAVVDAVAHSGEGQFKGVCSTYLANKKEGENVAVSVRSVGEEFRLPNDNARPIIMVGAGSGVAPFRGFLQERALQKRSGKSLGEAMLFFGCRHPQHDFIYQSELEEYVNSGDLDLHVAFSRNTEKKIYVQDLIKTQGNKVWELLQKDAKIYVCGDGSRMEPSVRKALTHLHGEKTGWNEEQSSTWMDELAANHSYVLDVWVAN